MSKYYVNAVASTLFILYSFWKLYDFFAPKVGPIGNGLSESLVQTVWVLFGISMILGFGVLFYSLYRIFKERRKKEDS